MAEVRDISEIVLWIREVKDIIQKGTSLGVVEATNLAQNLAKQNVQRNFKGSSKRPKTGNLANSIYMKFHQENNGDISGFIGSNALYARQREFGGTILPVKAKYLWIPLFGKGDQVKGSTPTDFMNIPGPARKFLHLKSGREGWLAGILTNKLKIQHKFTKNGKRISKKNAIRSSSLINRLLGRHRGIQHKVKLSAGKDMFTPLFLLLKSVYQEGRPYLQPAAQEAGQRLPEFIAKRVEEQKKLMGTKGN